MDPRARWYSGLSHFITGKHSWRDMQRYFVGSVLFACQNLTTRIQLRCTLAGGEVIKVEMWVHADIYLNYHEHNACNLEAKA